MKNAIFKDALKEIIKTMDAADLSLKKMATPDKTQYEKRKEWNEKTLEEIRAMPPDEAIKQLMKHRGR